MAVGAIEFALVCDVIFDLLFHIESSLEISDILYFRDIASWDVSILNRSLQKYPPHQCNYIWCIVLFFYEHIFFWKINMKSIRKQARYYAKARDNVDKYIINFPATNIVGSIEICFSAFYLVPNRTVFYLSCIFFICQMEAIHESILVLSTKSVYGIHFFASL